MRSEGTATRQVAETGDDRQAATLSEDGIIVEAGPVAPNLVSRPKSYGRRSSAASFMGWSNAAKAVMPAAARPTSRYRTRSWSMTLEDMPS